MRVDVDGLPEAIRFLKRVDPELAKRLTAAMRTVAREVAEDARARAPRKTGKLQRSIRGGASGKRAYVRSRLPYAAIHEHGGTVRLRRGRQKGDFMRVPIRPKRFMRGAVDENVAYIERRVAEEVERALRGGA